MRCALCAVVLLKPLLETIAGDHISPVLLPSRLHAAQHPCFLHVAVTRPCAGQCSIPISSRTGSPGPTRCRQRLLPSHPTGAGIVAVHATTRAPSCRPPRHNTGVPDGAVAPTCSVPSCSAITASRSAAAGRAAVSLAQLGSITSNSM